MTGLEIREFRRSRGWTQADLARALGTDAVTVSRWERGVSTPRTGAQRRLSALGFLEMPMSTRRFVEDPTDRILKLESAMRQMKTLKRSVRRRT